MNSRLRRDVSEFLNLYYNFNLVDINRNGSVILEGQINIVDVLGSIWDTCYKVQILIPHLNYPNAIPEVKEVSKNIKRDWDFHISENGICCLAIPHKLILAERSGIVLIKFYQDFIYPFFVNHQHKLKTGKYVNGEFEHHEKGILQFYREELKTNDLKFTKKIIEAAIGRIKIGNNDQCPICNTGKYKKCCKAKADSILKYGLKRIKEDLNIYEIIILGITN
ncbi:hypothetical protein [Gelidibacter pelagius]|uniref:SEC-C motif-containing protein n=1 Tax=Gelidibacter pelagius TaxID=2819985 RepID=A0ABS3SUY8_9FLAO|nr:hypothetical protein [Gelidibacter pelagius]MBO3099498.1 hypothetical protein [Gelidibacter pelagius]